MLGSGLTAIFTEADLLASLIEVAVTVAVNALATEPGAT
jgi:hypothetical protein